MADSYWKDGKRFAPQAGQDLDALAREAGYLDAADMEMRDPAGFEQLRPLADGGDTQVADYDHLNTKAILGLLGGTAAAGLIPGIGPIGAAPAPAGLAASASPSAFMSSLPAGMTSAALAGPPAAASATASAVPKFFATAFGKAAKPIGGKIAASFAAPATLATAMARGGDPSAGSSAPPSAPPPDAKPQGFFGNPMVQRGLFELGGNLLAGYGQGQENEENRAFEANQNAYGAMINYLGGEQNSQRNDQRSRDDLALQASQLDPLAQQRYRLQMALMADKVNQWSPTTANFDMATGMGGFSGGYNGMSPGAFTKSLATPQAIIDAEMSDFRNPLANLNERVPVSNAYGEAGEAGAERATAIGQEAAAMRQKANETNMNQIKELAAQMARMQQFGSEQQPGRARRRAGVRY